MADQLPGGGDAVPTWLVAIVSVGTTIVGWRIWRPIGRWIAARLEADRQARAIERGDLVAQLQAQVAAAETRLSATREEMLELRQDLGEERELRMALAVENAVQKERIENLERSLSEEKDECRQAIARLEREIREMRRPPRGPHP